MNRSIAQLLIPTPLFSIAATVAVAVVGCDRGQIRVQLAPKESSAPQVVQEMAPAPADVGGTAPGGRLTWTLPQGWQEQAPSEFRVASFNIKGTDGTADMSIVPLSGSAGGDLANVNRWRGQVGLAPISADGFSKTAQPVQVGSATGDLYELAGENAAGEDARVLAVIQHRGDTTWFFKMTGNSALVAREKPAFIEFLKSVKFGADDAAALPPSHPPLDSAGLPPSHPPIDGMSMPAASGGDASAEAHPKWQVPAGWKEASAGPFLVSKFLVTGEGSAQASVNVSTSAGDGGGLVANVNRWRQQLGLGAMPEAELGNSLTSVDVAGGKATLTDMTGKDPKTGDPARLIAAIVPRQGQTWFFKLMGDAKVVEREKDAFTGFVRGTEYPNVR